MDIRETPLACETNTTLWCGVRVLLNLCIGCVLCIDFCLAGIHITKLRYMPPLQMRCRKAKTYLLFFGTTVALPPKSMTGNHGFIYLAFRTLNSMQKNHKEVDVKTENYLVLLQKVLDTAI